MLLHIPDLLTKDETDHCCAVLQQSQWADGRHTAGDQAAKIKNNLQIPTDSEEARALGDIVLRALGRNALFNSAALPLRVLPPMFNRYDPGMTFGAHTDNAIRSLPNGMRMRADVSTTLFLTDPDTYEGGELEIEDTYGTQRVKFAAGDAVLYPASSLHRVMPVTRGSRWASFFWTQSMIRSDEKRRNLFELDKAIQSIRAQLGDDNPGALGVVGHYHNLLREWAEL
ncbi:Fe2+-dependent dioxygenase [Thioclava sp. SK-1]|uniref:Fe2+-dependent dioxygenase n=1 Tax=Thioclava sp. SK-1 TaxID=1889770 RepID=UPI000824B1D5|nr:Fe2+-dependent dioxygenase [Thioclava sp. SK-1]OCX64456.1 Fe2+-dependent dioxygenase [Thioclava sp. SK-1]